MVKPSTFLIKPLKLNKNSLIIRFSQETKNKMIWVVRTAISARLSIKGIQICILNNYNLLNHLEVSHEVQD